MTFASMSHFASKSFASMPRMDRLADRSAHTCKRLAVLALCGLASLAVASHGQAAANKAVEATSTDPQTLIFRFTVSEATASAAWQTDQAMKGDDTAPATAPGLPATSDAQPSAPIQAGDRLTATDLVDLLATGQGHSAPASAMFNAAELGVWLENRATGEISQFVFAQCNDLSFENTDNGLVDQRVRCNGDLYGYTVESGSGLAIRRNDETVITIALAAGLYQLDAVPFRIDAPADR